jgi:hypothetical protein
LTSSSLEATQASKHISRICQSDLEVDGVKSLERYACCLDSEQEIQEKSDGIVMQIGLSSLPQ